MSLFKDIAEGQQFSIFKYLPQLLMVGGNMPKMESLDAQTLNRHSVDHRPQCTTSPVEDPLTAYEYGRLVGTKSMPPSNVDQGWSRSPNPAQDSKRSKLQLHDLPIGSSNCLTASCSKFFTA